MSDTTLLLGFVGIVIALWLAGALILNLWFIHKVKKAVKKTVENQGHTVKSVELLEIKRVKAARKIYKVQANVSYDDVATVLEFWYDAEKSEIY